MFKRRAFFGCVMAAIVAPWKTLLAASQREIVGETITELRAWPDDLPTYRRCKFVWFHGAVIPAPPPGKKVFLYDCRMEWKNEAGSDCSMAADSIEVG